jgi:hypothetical protein
MVCRFAGGFHAIMTTAAAGVCCVLEAHANTPTLIGMALFTGGHGGDVL